MGEMAFDAYINFEGQLCLDNGQQRSVLLLPQAVTGAGRLYSVRMARPSPGWRRNASTLTASPAPSGRRRRKSPPIPEVAPIPADRSYQATAFLLQKRGPLEGLCSPTGSSLQRWSEGGGHIPEAGGRAAGMRLFSRASVSRLECMAFGDAENDLDMLAYAGIGVAMGNASKR